MSRGGVVSEDVKSSSTGWLAGHGVLSGNEVESREVAKPADGRYLGVAMRFYGSDAFPTLHCLWPDREGRFPWDAGSRGGFRRLQPMRSDGPELWTQIRPSDQ